MNTNNSAGVPYLRTSRRFPEELHQLSVEINRAYTDIANAVNNRTISIFPMSQPVTPTTVSGNAPTPNIFPAITGESWYTSGTKQQTFRQVYQFLNVPTNATSYINHGISSKDVVIFTVIRGIGFDGGGNYFPIPFVDGGSGVFDMTVFVNSTQIVLITGSSRSTTRGFILLEWLINV